MENNKEFVSSQYVKDLLNIQKDFIVLQENHFNI